MAQGTLTLISEVKGAPAELAPLRGTLEELQRTAAHGKSAARGPLGEVQGVHFARWALLEGTGSRLAQPCLVLGVDFSAEGRRRDLARCFVERLVDAMARRGDRLLDSVYRSCVGYPCEGLQQPDAVKRYLLGRSVAHTARYIAFPYRAADTGDLRELVALRTHVDRLLDEERERLERGARAPRAGAALREWLEREARERHPALFAPAFEARWTEARRAAARATVLYLGVAPIPWLIRHARRLRPARARTDAPAMATAGRVPSGAGVAPDEAVQNPLTHVATVKPGRTNVLLLRALLALVNLRMQRYVAGLNFITTIHFARWVLFKDPGPQGRHRLLFFSNYDGSWDAYINSFLENEEVRTFLVLIWSRTEGFPGGGDPEAFKAWLTAGQVQTDVWHSTYRPLGRVSAVDAHHALHLRQLLEGRPEDGDELEAYLATGVCQRCARPGPEQLMMPLSGALRELLGSLVRRPARRAPRGRTGHGAAREPHRTPAPVAAAAAHA